MPPSPYSANWLIEPLGDGHDREGFSCGNPALDKYLREQAGQDYRRGYAAPFVLVLRRGAAEVFGYYTLSSYGIELGNLPIEVAKKLPRYPLVPATLIGRLAVDKEIQGQRAGEFLLLDALDRARTQALQVGSAAVVVDAIDLNAAKFYKHFGFIPFPDIANRLFLTMKAVASLFR